MSAEKHRKNKKKILNEKHRQNEEKILNEFLRIIFKYKFEENYITDPKNICYKFIDSLTGTCHKPKDFKELLENCFKRKDEYTDKCSEGLPDFYLRSKVNRVTDLAIEVKTLQRDYDRFADYNETSEIKVYKRTIGDFELVIYLEPPGYILPPPKKVIKLWNEFENELKEFERSLEYIVDTMNIIEKKLEDENQDMYLKDLSYKKKKELMEIIDGLKKIDEDERFTKGTDFTYTLSRFEIDLRIDKEESSFETSDNDKIGNVREIIKRDKRRFLEQCVENFLTDYFNETVCENHYSSCIAKVSSQKQENKFIFTVYFIKTWESEDVNFHVEKVEEFIEESRKKFEKLRLRKSDNSGQNPHIELLLIKLTSFMTVSFDDHVKELYEKLVQRGYNYPFYPIKVQDNLSKFYMICMNS